MKLTSATNRITSLEEPLHLTFPDAFSTFPQGKLLKNVLQNVFTGEWGATRLWFFEIVQTHTLTGKNVMFILNAFQNYPVSAFNH